LNPFIQEAETPVLSGDNGKVQTAVSTFFPRSWFQQEEENDFFFAWGLNFCNLFSLIPFKHIEHCIKLCRAAVNENN
jgi:hypothetical protein